MFACPMILTLRRYDIGHSGQIYSIVKIDVIKPPMVSWVKVDNFHLTVNRT